MNRRYTAEEYGRGCELLRKYFGIRHITTDVIVGFPGDRRRRFERQAHIWSSIHFYEMHIFQYSKREGTKAAVMPDQLTEQVKKERSEKLIALGQDMSRSSGQFIRTEEEVLFEEQP